MGNFSFLLKNDEYESLDLQLELLGIEEQENIICILNTIKRLITKRKFQLDELNLLVKSRYSEEVVA
ncbi:type I restriction-modification system subunit S [Streptococcus pneumoniae]|nr:type I restriction-modification system subunit S [Streptococcus pneumoniae]